MNVATWTLTIILGAWCDWMQCAVSQSSSFEWHLIWFLWTWLNKRHLCSYAGAFKTLDKNNSGTVRVNIKEVWVLYIILWLYIFYIFIFYIFILLYLLPWFIFPVAAADYVLLKKNESSLSHFNSEHMTASFFYFINHYRYTVSLFVSCNLYWTNKTVYFKKKCNLCTSLNKSQIISIISDAIILNISNGQLSHNI